MEQAVLLGGCIYISLAVAAAVWDKTSISNSAFYFCLILFPL